MFRFTSAYEDEPSLSLYTGLARALSGDHRLRCRYGCLSSLDLGTSVIELPDVYRIASGRKREALERAEVYLRAAGSARLTDLAALEHARRQAEGFPTPRLAWQWLMTVEDARLMTLLSHERPRLAGLFARRAAFHRLRVRRQATWRDSRNSRTPVAERVYLDLHRQLEAIARASGEGPLEGDTEAAMRWAIARLWDALAMTAVEDLEEEWLDVSWGSASDVAARQASGEPTRSRGVFEHREDTEHAAQERVEISDASRWWRSRSSARGARERRIARRTGSAKRPIGRRHHRPGRSRGSIAHGGCAVDANLCG